MHTICGQRFNPIGDISGLYALKHPVLDFVYIGKAAVIYDRLRMHYNECGGKFTSACWSQFFPPMNENLTAYWFQVSPNADGRDEYVRQALERALQLKYNPLFDRMYPKKPKRPVNDFTKRIYELTGVTLR